MCGTFDNSINNSEEFLNLNLSEFKLILKNLTIIYNMDNNRVPYTSYAKTTLSCMLFCTMITESMSFIIPTPINNILVL